MRAVVNTFWEVVKIILIALVIVVPLRVFVFQPFLVRGASMEPNFHNGDYLIVDELSYRFRDPERGEVIVFKFPQDPSQRYIKRIIGLPGETVQTQNGSIIISSSENGEDTFILDETEYLSSLNHNTQFSSFVLEEDEYFVLGDNRRFSSDSRRWGVLPEKNIVGRTLIRLLPPNAFAKVEVPQY